MVLVKEQTARAMEQNGERNRVDGSLAEEQRLRDGERTVFSTHGAGTRVPERKNFETSAVDGTSS